MKVIPQHRLREEMILEPGVKLRDVGCFFVYREPEASHGYENLEIRSDDWTVNPSGLEILQSTAYQQIIN